MIRNDNWWINYLNCDGFAQTFDGIGTGSAIELFRADGNGLVAEQGPDTLVRGIANGRQIVAAFQGHDDFTVGQFHQLTGHEPETGGRHVVTAQRRRVPRSRVESRRYQHYLRIKILKKKNFKKILKLKNKKKIY